MGKFICFNGRFEKASSFHLSIENRAFRYGDGFFETMHYAFGEVQVFAIHHKRILRAMQLLQLSSSLLETLLFLPHQGGTRLSVQGILQRIVAKVRDEVEFVVVGTQREVL